VPSGAHGTAISVGAGLGLALALADIASALAIEESAVIASKLAPKQRLKNFTNFPPFFIVKAKCIADNNNLVLKVKGCLSVSRPTQGDFRK
jgi:hypothetical protein